MGTESDQTASVGYNIWLFLILLRATLVSLEKKKMKVKIECDSNGGIVGGNERIKYKGGSRM